MGQVDLPLLRSGSDRACRDTAVEAEDAPNFHVGTSRAHRIGGGTTPAEPRSIARSPPRNSRDALKRGGVPLGPNMLSMIDFLF